MTTTFPAFDLADRLKDKRDLALIGGDEEHFAAISAGLVASVADLSDRLEAVRVTSGGGGQQAMERDLEIHRLTARLALLRRFDLDLCLGRMVGEDGSEPLYIGRFGLTDAEGRRLLVDWRTPAAEPFFAATHANRMGLVSRRRYRWTRGRVSDYWDEVFVVELAGPAAPDDESAFIASLGSIRSPQMRDVLSTIQADQDAIIRTGSRGALVVDGGPGTGKTVVALHRAAYLLYSDPRVIRGGGVLFVGPSSAYLSYVEDILPSLGEDTVRICTMGDLVPESGTAMPESDPEVAALKSSARLVDAIEAAVRFHEVPPAEGMTVETPWADLELGASEWADAFDQVDAGTSHNEARDQVWEALLDILIDRLDGEDVPLHLFRRELQRNEELARVFATAWPLLDPVGVVADLWSVPAYLRECAPWLTPPEVQRLLRADARRWTTSDLPILDAARQLIGDPGASRRSRQREAALATERERMDRVVDDLIASDDSELLLMTMLRGQDLQNSLVDESAVPTVDPDLLAGPFAHIIVDEAQELTDAQWRMLLRRCPSRSFTVVGDRAQARHGFTEAWSERLNRLGLPDVETASLSVNYRTPEEVMAEAAPVIRAAIPDANVPTSVRSSGIAVEHGSVSELGGISDAWMESEGEGTACVIGTSVAASESPRIRSLTPEMSKGLEFDLVVLVDPDSFGDGIEGAVDRYVAMTRATQRLVILTP